MNVEHERHFVLRDRVASWREEKLIGADAERAALAQLEQPWRSHGVVVQCVFFLLTCVGMVAAYFFCEAVDVPREGLVVGVASIALAESLIRARRWFGTGVEGALWIGGLVALILELPSSGKPEALLVFAAAAAISGARVRNPVFGTLAAILVVIYAETKNDLGVITSIVIASIAVLALLRTWRRPSTEWLWILIAIALPVAGRMTADARWQLMTIALYGFFGALALTLALLKRHHALFLAGAAGFTIAGIEIGRILETPLEVKLAAAGIALLALSYLVGRLLRDRTTGIVVTPATLTRADEALEVAGALAGAHATRTEPGPETRPRGEGGFGGAGASGEL